MNGKYDNRAINQSMAKAHKKTTSERFAIKSGNSNRWALLRIPTDEYLRSEPLFDSTV